MLMLAADLRKDTIMPPRMSRRFLLSNVPAAMLLTGLQPADAAELKCCTRMTGFTAEQIALRDAANLARSKTQTSVAGRYQPFYADVIHVFEYGQSLSQGYQGSPPLSTMQPLDNEMIGNASRAAVNSNNPPTTTWVPLGTPDGTGTYPFEPLIAVKENKYADSDGETSGVGALNFFRRLYLQMTGAPPDANTHFVLTDCGIGGQTLAQLSYGANPDVFNRLIQAAQAVQARATAMGLTYQVGFVNFMQGEQDVTTKTPYATYLAELGQVQQDFLTYVVQGVAGQAEDVVIPWFSYQPNSISHEATVNVHQALLDWSNTPNSDFYLAGTVYPYTNIDVHLTANGYRNYGNKAGEVIAAVLINGVAWTPLYVTGATVSGYSVMVSLNVPYPPIMIGDVYVGYTKTTYPNLGFLIKDAKGKLPISSVAIAGQATITIELGRALVGSAILQAGYNQSLGTDWGTNICDSDPTIADDTYVYQSGVQNPGEDITTWNGNALIGQPYPMNNYLAISQVPILASS
jgi:hypothetical protein